MCVLYGVCVDDCREEMKKKTTKMKIDKIGYNMTRCVGEKIKDWKMSFITTLGRCKSQRLLVSSRFLYWKICSMFLCPSGVFDVQVVHKIVKTMSDNGQFVYKKMDFCFMIYLLGVNWRQKKKIVLCFLVCVHACTLTLLWMD